MRRVAQIAAAALASVACQSPGVPTAEIPGEFIALHYRNPELARRRAESLEEAQDPGVPGVAPVDELAKFVNTLFAVGGGLVPRDPFAGQLALLDPRTGKIQPIPDALRGAIPLAWSSDHSRLLFTQRSGGLLQIFELDRRRRHVRQITTGPEAHPRACYGPDGRFVLMVVENSDLGLRTRIVVTDRGGTGSSPLSINPVAHSPACAPDGSAVAWVEPRRHNVEHIIVRSPVLTGANRTLAPGREPTFTPDGRWIAYSALRQKEWRLWRVRPDGTARAPIGQGMYTEQRPTISPDGRLVAYVAELAHRQQLYLRRFDGSGDRILFANGDGAFPVW